jgi:acetyl-CoA acetyltransferase
MTTLFRDRAAIVGIGETAFTRHGDRSELDLAAEAIVAACDDAGIALEDVDGLVRYHVEQVDEVALFATLGIRPRWYALTPSGGGGLASTIALASLAVASGAANVVVTWRSRRRSPRGSYGSDPLQGGRPWAKMGSDVGGPAQFHHPFGLASPAQEMALIARRHMHVFGTLAEHFGMQAVVQRGHAARNPRAILREPITLDDWRASRVVADPLRVVDCSLECDGAVALVVVAVERAADCRHRPVLVRAAAMGEAPIHTQLADFFRLTCAYGGHRGGAVAVGERLFAEAGIGPEEVDCAMIFDHFTPAVVMSLEQYGFCPLGEGGPFVASGATRWPDGRLPVNTHGGSNGEAFIHGFNHLSEAVRQLRGTAVNQVPDCEIVFVCGSITDPSGAMILRR